MRRLAALLLSLSLAGPAASAGPMADGFAALLDEAELVFAPPAGYVELPPGRTPMLDYERALRSPSGDLEIRLAVRPLKRLRIDMTTPGVQKPHWLPWWSTIAACTGCISPFGPVNPSTVRTARP